MRLIDVDVLPNYKCKVAATIGDKTDPAWMRFAFWEDIEKAPTIDAVEVVHGRWETVTVEAYFVPTIEEKTKRDFPCCSRCHQIQSIAAWTKPFNYCPNCGAKMDGKEG